MKYNEVIKKMSTIHNGAWFSLTYTKEVTPSAKGKKSGVTCIVKESSMTVRKGVRYENISGVESKHQGLPWGEWKVDGLVITHKGEDYLRVYTSPNPAKVRWFVDGREMTSEEVMESGLIRKSDMKPTDSQVMCLKFSGIKEV